WKRHGRGLSRTLRGLWTDPRSSRWSPETAKTACDQAVRGVELRGFEPLTPCMPCKCSARLSYSPKNESVYQEPPYQLKAAYASEVTGSSQATRGASSHRRSSP